MKKLVCELCGCDRVLKADGIFTCQECGAQYSPDEARNLLVDVDDPEPSPPEPQQTVCPSCGAILREGLKFCTSCGGPLTATTPGARSISDYPSVLSLLNGGNKVAAVKEYMTLTGCSLRDASRAFDEFSPTQSASSASSDQASKLETFAMAASLLSDFSSEVHGLRCPRCGSHDVSVVREESGAKTSGRSETRKKSAITRAGNSAGRAGMVMATGGLWALTPKKSKYTTSKSSSTKIKYSKRAVCNHCGRDWKI